tara:strand:+ start:33034 stop:33303 length:270 start_codon:yes stop_codon:yes gene_type:complete
LSEKSKYFQILVLAVLCNIYRNFTSNGCIHQSKSKKMSIWRVLLAILFPPLAVIGKGCGSIIIVFLLTLCGWVPGVIAALVILNNPDKY